MQDSTKRYKCLSCGQESASFMNDCACGASSGYRNVTVGQERQSPAVTEEAIDSWASYVSLFNPYAPT